MKIPNSCIKHAITNCGVIIANAAGTRVSVCASAQLITESQFSASSIYAFSAPVAAITP